MFEEGIRYVCTRDKWWRWIGVARIVLKRRE
jgi:hypothetical protein